MTVDVILLAAEVQPVSTVVGSYEQRALTNRGNDVGQDVVFGTLLRQCLGESDHGQLRSRIVGLAKVTE